jgi:hypothetical protein
MPSVNKYKKEYIDGCHSKMKAQLAAYRSLVSKVREKAGTSRSTLGEAIDTFEPLFFRNLVLVLDQFFAHRTPELEKKDGNALNEVRMLCNSLLHHDGVLTADKTIKYSASTSILKLQIGNEIQLTEEKFRNLFKAFFSEIEAKFT